MLEQDRGTLYDAGMALGLLIAFFLYAPAYLVLATARRLKSVGEALRPARRLSAAGGCLLRTRIPGA